MLPNDYQTALSLQRQGRLEEAIELHRSILQRQPEHHGALHSLGMALFFCNKIDEAVGFVEQSLTLCATKAAYHNNYGTILNRLNKLDEARIAFERALALQPDYADALSNLGSVFLQLRRPPDETERLLSRAIGIQPNHTNALLHFANLFIGQAKFLEALPYLEKHVSLVPPSARLYHQLAHLYGECGKHELSKQFFHQASALLDGKDVWRWKYLAYCSSFFETEEEIDRYWNWLNAELDVAVAESPFYNWRTLGIREQLGRR